MGIQIGGHAPVTLATAMDCAHCGASLPVPVDLAVVSVTCQYCNAHQPVPDLAARRKALALEEKIDQERRDEALAAEQGRAFQRDIQKQTKWAMLPGIIIGGCSVVFAIFMMARSFMITSHVMGSISTPSIGGGWDGTRTLECHRGDSYDLVGQTAHVKGVAIHATDGCVVNYTGGSIRAETAIQASGGAVINLTGVTIDASTAVDASSGAVVTVHGGNVKGKVHKSGNAKVIGL